MLWMDFLCGMFDVLVLDMVVEIDGVLVVIGVLSLINFIFFGEVLSGGFGG